MTWGTISGGPTNLFTWNSLYPYNYASNYGGQYQFNVMPMTYTPQQAFDIQNLFNPFYQMNKMMNMFNASMNPFQNMQQVMLNQAAYNNGFRIGESAALNEIGRNTALNITSLKSQLEQALTSDKLYEEQKNELRALKREVEALEDKIADIEYLKQNGASTEQVRTALRNIDGEYRVIRDKVQKAAEKIQAEVTAETTEEATEETVDTTEETTTEEVTTQTTEKVGELNTASFNENMVAADVDDENVREVVNTIYRKVDGMGSGNIKSYLDENVNKDNVVEIMLQWNKHYAEEYKDADPLGLTETLMDERSVSGYKLCTQILDSLEARLKDYQGINSELYNTASVELAKARREHDAWWVNEDKMSESINIAHKCIVILMAEKAKQD